jgi:hypothetical protein
LDKYDQGFVFLINEYQLLHFFVIVTSYPFPHYDRIALPVVMTDKTTSNYELIKRKNYHLKTICHKTHSKISVTAIHHAIIYKALREAIIDIWIALFVFKTLLYCDNVVFILYM